MSMALVRQCDRCGATTAADLDATEERALAMSSPGQTVRVVTEAECRRLWQLTGGCICHTRGPATETTRPAQVIVWSRSMGKTYSRSLISGGAS